MTVIHLQQRQPVCNSFVMAQFTGVGCRWMGWIGAEFAFPYPSTVVTARAGATAYDFAMVYVYIEQPALIDVAGNTTIGSQRMGGGFLRSIVATHSGATGYRLYFCVI